MSIEARKKQLQQKYDKMQQTRDEKIRQKQKEDGKKALLKEARQKADVAGKDPMATKQPKQLMLERMEDRRREADRRIEQRQQQANLEVFEAVDDGHCCEDPYQTIGDSEDSHNIVDLLWNHISGMACLQSCKTCF